MLVIPSLTRAWMDAHARTHAHGALHGLQVYVRLRAQLMAREHKLYGNTAAHENSWCAVLAPCCKACVRACGMGHHAAWDAGSSCGPQAGLVRCDVREARSVRASVRCRVRGRCMR